MRSEITPSDMDGELPSPPLPVGDHYFAFWHSAAQASLLVLMAVVFVVVSLVAVSGVGPLPPLLQGVGLALGLAFGGIPAGLMLVAATATVYRARRPALRVTAEGIIVLPEPGLLRFLSLGSRPDPDLIPWAAIRGVEPGPMKSVIIDYEGYEMSRSERSLQKRRNLPRGRIVSFDAMGRVGSELRQQLYDWSEEKQLAEVRQAARLGGKSPRRVGSGSVRIDASLVETLVASQFPQWAEKPVERVENDGHDNRTFRLGDEMGVRMPSAERYATHVGIEQEWLPRLAPHLPLPVPTPVGRGRPGQGYPWAWTVNGWIRGENASIERISDLSEFARDLAKFLNALQSIDATTAPEPGRHNFFRGGALSVYDGETRECLEAVGDMIDVRAAASAWESALEAEWSGPPVWIHGDVAQDNLLVDDGRLCGVIDFGQLAAGDPSCDVTIAWTLFSGASREAFRSDLAVDEATWARGRGWGLWKALLQLRAGRTSNSEAVARAKRVIRSIIAEG